MNYLEYIDAYRELIKKFGIEPSKEVIALIFQNTEQKLFKKGEIILKQGEVSNEAYFMIKGLVRSYNILPNGTEKTYIICREQNLFNEYSSFMTRKPSTEYLEAIEETVVLCVSYENLIGLYDKYHTWATIGRKISDLNYIVSLERLKLLMNKDAEQRYNRFLELFHTIIDRIPQNVAASYLGITPQSFSRLKREIKIKPELQNVVINKTVNFHQKKETNTQLNISDQDLTAFYEQIKSIGSNPSIDDLALILPYVTQKSFKKGDLLLQVGDIYKEIYFNTKGIARTYFQLPNGSEKTYYILPEHTFFSDYASFIAQKPCTENIEAIEDMDVYCIGYENLMYLYENYHIWEKIGRYFCDFNFTFAQKRLRSMMNDDASTRYKKFTVNYTEILHRIPQHIVASYLGITPQSFSRLKKEMDAL